MEKALKRNNGIDLFRLIGAFFIMLLHADYGENLTHVAENIKLSGRWAVPFFFICTGFFINHKITNTNKIDFYSIENNIARLISILVITSLIYTPLNLAQQRHLPNDIKDIFIGSYDHLWFIGSLIFGYVFIWYIYYINRTKLLPLISIVILAMGLLYNSYDNIFNISLNYDLPRFMLSIPFLYIGILTASISIPRKYISILLILTITGFVLQYYEAYLLFTIFDCAKDSNQFLLGTLVMVIPLFALTTLLNISDNTLSTYGKKYSLFIYLYHPLLYSIMRWISKIFIPDKYIEQVKILNPLLGFFLILSACVLLNKYFKKSFNFLNGNVAKYT